MFLSFSTDFLYSSSAFSAFFTSACSFFWFCCCCRRLDVRAFSNTTLYTELRRRREGGDLGVGVAVDLNLHGILLLARALVLGLGLLNRRLRRLKLAQQLLSVGLELLLDDRQNGASPNR